MEIVDSTRCVTKRMLNSELDQTSITEGSDTDGQSSWEDLVLQAFIK